MSEESPPTYTTPIFNQAYFNTSAEDIDTAYLNSNYLRYPIAQTGLETIANLATTTLTATTLTATNDATINGLTVGRGGGSLSTNTALGVSALSSNVNPGQYNTAIGYQALKLNSYATSNTAVGYAALSNTTTGGFNTAFGINTLLNNVSSLNNTAIGAEALNLTTGGSNTALGFQAGRAQTSGTNNTYIGALAQANANTYTNSTALGYNATITASNQVVLGTTTETVVIPNQINFNYTSNPTLAVGSIGYTYSSSISSITISNNSQGLLSTISSVPIGVYLVQYLTTYYDVVGTATNTRIKTFAGITSFGKEIANNNVVYFTSNDYISATLSVVYTNTAVSNFQLNGALNGSSTSIKSYISEGGYFRATRIA